jgi:hypothetical protein
MVFAGLAAPRHQERAEAVEAVRSAVRRNGRLKFRGLDKLFDLLSTTLTDSNWNVRRDTIALLTEVVSKSNHELEKYINRVVPQLVHNLGDTKVVIRRGAAAAIEMCFAHTSDTQLLGTAIAQEGIENPEMRVRNETLRFLEQPLLWKRSSQDVMLHVLRAVVGRLRDVETEVLQTACRVLAIIPDFISKAVFDDLIVQLPSMLRELFDSVNKLRLHQDASSRAGSARDGSLAGSVGGGAADRGSSRNSVSPTEPLEFGLIPMTLVARLQDKDWEVKTAAIEQFRSLAHQIERVKGILPHLGDLIRFLIQMMSDSNLKITLTTIEILEQLVVKVGWPMRTFLDQLMDHHVGMLGDSKIVLRQAATKLIIKMMQAMTPTPVLEILMRNLHDSSWRVREEIINVVIVSMSIFPRQQFDFQVLVNDLAPALSDTKSRVKFVAIEAFAVIQNLNGEDVLMGHLQNSNLSMKTLQQLQSRFSAAQDLPTIGGDGLVEHRVEPVSVRTDGTDGGASVESSGYAQRHGMRRGSGSASAGSAANAKLPWNDPNKRRAPSRESQSGYTPSPSGSATRRRQPTTSIEPVEREGSYASMYKAKMAGRSTTTPLPGGGGSDGGGDESSGGRGNGAGRGRGASKSGAGGSYGAPTRGRSACGSDYDGSPSPDVPNSPFPTSAKVVRPSSLRRSSFSKGSTENLNSPDGAGPAVQTTGAGAGAGTARSGLGRAPQSVTPTDSVEFAERERMSRQQRIASVDSASSIKQTGIPTPWGASTVADSPVPPGSTRKSVPDSPFRVGTPKLTNRSRASSATSVHDALGDHPHVEALGASEDAVTAAARAVSPIETQRDRIRSDPDALEPVDLDVGEADFIPQLVTKLERSGPIEFDQVSIESAASATSSSAEGGAHDADADAVLGDAPAWDHSGPEPAEDDAKSFIFADDDDNNPTVFKDEDDTPFTRTPSPSSSIGEVADDDVFTDPENDDLPAASKPVVNIPPPKGRSGIPGPGANSQKAPAEAQAVTSSSSTGLKVPGKKKGVPTATAAAAAAAGTGNGKPPKAPKSPTTKSKKTSVNKKPGASPATPRRPPVRTGPGAKAAAARGRTTPKSPCPDVPPAKSPEPQRKMKSPEPPRKKMVKKTVRAPSTEPLKERSPPAPEPEMSAFEKELIANAKSGKSSNFSRSHATTTPNPDEPGPPETATKPRPPKGPRAGLRGRKQPATTVGAPVGDTDGSSPTGGAGNTTDPDADGIDRSDSPTRSSPQQSKTETPTRTRGSNRRPPRPETKSGVGPPPGSSSGARSVGTPARGVTSQSNRSDQNPGDGFLVERGELKPYGGSIGGALKQAFASMQRGHSQETWLAACEGLNIVRQLLCFNEDTVTASLHMAVEAVCAELQNLRSQVGRLAILTIGDFFEVLGKGMHEELDLVMSALYKKVSADAGNSFVQDALAVTCAKVVANASHRKVLGAVVAGAAHKTSLVRQVVFETIEELIAAEGSKILSFKEAERMMMCLIRCMDDKEGYNRYLGRRAFFLLMEFPDYPQFVRKSLPEKMQKSAAAVVDKLRKNGLGAPVANPRDKSMRMAGMSANRSASSAEPGSPRGRSMSAGESSLSTPSGGMSGGGSSSAGAASGLRSKSSGGSGLKRGVGSIRSAKSTKSQHGPSLSSASLEELESFVDKLGNSDWKVRDAGVIGMEHLAMREGIKMQSALNKLFDAFTPRLADSNSKVNLHALEAFRRFLPAIKDAFGTNHAVVVQVVNKLSGNLASKSSGIRLTSVDTFKDLVVHLEPTLLLQPFAACAVHGTQKVKEGLMPHICKLVDPVCNSNVKLVKKHLIPLLTQLLGEKKDARECATLCGTLLDKMGREALLGAASSLPPNKMKLLETQLTNLTK